MSVLKAALALLTENPSRKYDTGGLVHALGLDDGSTLSVALSDLVKRGAVQREKKLRGLGSWYFVGDRDSPPAAGVTAPPNPGAAAPGKPGNRAAPPRSGKRRAGNKAPAGRSGPVNPQVPALLPVNGGDAEAVFAIRSDGRLGISCGPEEGGGPGVSLAAADVRRLQTFLIATSMLWDA